MIYYFTGNGNSRWVAEQIAAATDDEITNISELLKNNIVPEISDDTERVGIVFPVHSWYAPRPVVDFVSQLQIPKKVYRFAVCTCGDDAGKCMQRLHRHYKYNAAWSVQMPNTYIPMFELDSDTVARLKVKEAKELIADIAKDILEKRKTRFVFEGAFPRTKTYIINPLFVHCIISPKGFHVDDGCIACGTCRDVCPMSNIKLQDGIPVWGNNCIHCMACIHSCPQRVIQYKQATQRKGRYRLKNYIQETD
jgi:ferredoxin